MLQHVAEHLDYLFFTVDVTSAQHSSSVCRWVLLPRSEACIPLPGSLSHRRINSVEVRDDRVNRREKAVEIQPIETGIAIRIVNFGVVRAQPFDKFQGFLCSPPPRWESRESLPLIRSDRGMADILVDSRSIGPIGLDRDEVEALAQNQFLRDARAHPVELRSSVSGLAEQDDLRIGDPIEQRAEVDFVDVIDRLGVFANQFRDRFRRRRPLGQGDAGLPALCADQWNELHRAKIFFVVSVFTYASYSYETLQPRYFAHRDDKTGTDRELFKKRLRYLRSSCCDYDHVVRRMFGPT